MTVKVTSEQQSSEGPANSGLRAPGRRLPGQVGDEIIAAPNAPWFLRHHPGSWEVATVGLEKATWLPRFKPFVIRPGCGGVRTLPNRDDDPTDAYASAIEGSIRRDHWVYVYPYPIMDPAFLPEGVPVGAEYMRFKRCRARVTQHVGLRHFEVWDIPVPWIPDENQHFETDRAARNRWRLDLVLRSEEHFKLGHLSGMIGEPPAHLIARNIAALATRVRKTEAVNWPTEGIREARVAEALRALDLAKDAEVPA